MNRLRVRTLGWIVAAALMLPSAGRAGAQTTRPGNASSAPPGQFVAVQNAATNVPAGVAAPPIAPAPRKSGSEQIEIVRRTGGSTTAPTTRRATSQGGSNGLETTRVVMALGIVLGMIFLMRFLGRKFFPAAAGVRSSQVIRVLSRSAIAPRQQFLLVQVGKRLIVVGDSGTSMNSLAEISDPDEVAALVGQVDAERSDSVSKAFGSLFGKAQQPFESMSVADTTDRTDDDEVDADETPSLAGSNVTVNAPDDAVSYARGELSGLADQVRLLSKQFKSS